VDRVDEPLPAEGVIDTLSSWAACAGLRALWLVGSFATRTADRWSDIDLRGVVPIASLDLFDGVERNLQGVEGWAVVKQRVFTLERGDGEMVVLFSGGFELDFHFVPPEQLTASFVGPYPVRVLLDHGCGVSSLSEDARRALGASAPAAVEARVSRAVYVWDHLHLGLVAYLRGQYSRAAALLEASRSALGQLSAGQREGMPPAPGTAAIRHLSEADRAILDRTIPAEVIGSMPEAIRRIASVLCPISRALEASDATCRLVHYRCFTQALIDSQLGR